MTEDGEQGSVIPGLVLGTEEEGRAMIGVPTEVVVAKLRPDPSWVRGFCGIIEDANPRYWSDQPGGEVPPAMLLSLVMPPPWSPDGAAALPPLCVRIPLPGDTVINSSQAVEFRRPLQVGQLLTMQEVLTELSAVKETPLGTGHFVTTESTFRNEDGDTVAVLTNVLFRYVSRDAAK